MQFFSYLRMACLASAVTLVACSGQVADTSAEPSGEGGAAGGDATGGAEQAGSSGGNGGAAGNGVSSIACKPTNTQRAVPRVPLRRLTRDEYNNSVRDLLGDTSSPAKLFAADERSGRFLSNSNAPLNAMLYSQQQAAAETLADKAVANLSKIVPCDPKAMGDDACGTAFIAAFGKRAFRRPLDASETKRYQQVFSTAKTGATFVDGVRDVVTAMLQSPNFLYHVEFGSPGAKDANVRLSSYESVSRLSYFLWQSMPDDEALSLADKNPNLSAGQVTELAKRMMASPKFIEGVTTFHLQWLGIDGIGGMIKDAAAYPSFSPALRDAMLEETKRFIANWASEDDSKVESLLMSRKTFLSKSLASVYGLPAPATDWTAVTLPSDQRVGILTQASVLGVHAHTDQTAPINRGRFIREALLCQPISPPPKNVNTTVPAPTAGVTLRQRLDEHRVNPSCAGCHSLMDPIGLAFDRYDGLGKYNAQRNGAAVDDSGKLTESGDADGDFAGAVGLATKLSSSNTFRQCVATQWYSFAMGGSVSELDECAQADLMKQFAASNYNVRSLLLSLANLDEFRFTKALVP
jgi:hypothetical protein